MYLLPTIYRVMHSVLKIKITFSVLLHVFKRDGKRKKKKKPGLWYQVQFTINQLYILYIITTNRLINHRC